MGRYVALGEQFMNIEDSSRYLLVDLTSINLGTKYKRVN